MPHRDGAWRSHPVRPLHERAVGGPGRGRGSGSRPDCREPKPRRNDRPPGPSIEQGSLRLSTYLPSMFVGFFAAPGGANSTTISMTLVPWPSLAGVFV